MATPFLTTLSFVTPCRLIPALSIVVGFFNQILGSLEPRQQIDGSIHIGHEHPIGILWRVEQLVLLALRFSGVGLLFITQDDKPVRLAPAFRLIAEFALAVGIGARGA